MTAYDPSPLYPYGTQPGCTSCGELDTVTFDGINGRRCANCPPTFDPDTAVDLVLRGLPGAAMAYLRGAA